MATSGYGPLVTQVTQNLRRLREERGVTLSGLSDRMGELGQPLGMTGLSKIENGRRGIDLDELVALARALEVPPLLLVFPLGVQEAVEVLPGANVETWAAAKWFTGEAPFPGTEDEVCVGSDPPTTYFRVQDELIEKWRRVRERVDEVRGAHIVGQGADDQSMQGFQFLEEMLRSSENHLRDYRRIMRKVGLDPGELPPELAHVDKG
ncbi:MAG: helix-turn-helix transcriptional regulator [Actinomycetota bacterium]|nr:helix-turn-helix transcriptional regulator [Actinomycetota bacterium]